MPGYEASRVIVDDGSAAEQRTATAAVKQGARTDAAALTQRLGFLLPAEKRLDDANAER